MSQRSTTWLLLCAGALVVAAGCSREPDEADRSPGVEPAAESEVAQDLSDTWITTKIQAKYFADADVKGRNIDVTTSDGVVTLTGVVEDQQARQQAVAIARNTDDVVRVEDRLTAEAPPPPPTAGDESGPRADADRDAVEIDEDADLDDQLSNVWITTKIQSKYFVDAIVKGRNIDVTTNNGVVTLEGRVASPTERDHAVQLARSTDGVRRVEDRLMVDEPSQRTAEETSEDMAAGTEKRPLPSPEAPAAPAPGSAPALAGDDTAPPAVGVTPPLPGERPTTGAEADERMTDAGITTRIQSKFFLDDQVKPRDVTVATTNGVVTLSGEVSSDSQKQRALSLARSVHGVVDVKDEIAVAGPGAAGAAAAPTWDMPTGALGDSWITTQIQSKYYTDAFVRIGDVEVTTSAGTVTLKGTVPSAEAKSRAETIAQETAGVKQVKNLLTVQADSGAKPAPGATMPESRPDDESGPSF